MAERTIGTHSGTFHCDEALGVGLLRLTSAFQDARVVRTRDQATLDGLSIIIDVGGTYEPARNRFDHHQRGFMETFDDKHSTKLSSAGLVYKHFGREIIQRVCQTEAPITELIYQRIYDSFIEHIDANDNGINAYPAEIVPKFDRGGTDLSSRVSRLNPEWNDANPQPDAQFEKAVAVTTTEFLERLHSFSKVWLPAREFVAHALAARHETHPSGQLIELKTFCPWPKHLSELETEQGLGDQVKYVLFTDQSGTWRVQAVAQSQGSFESRLALPEPWRGLRDDALSAAAGIPGAIFVHASGFIGGTKTREGAFDMATKALAFGR